MVNRAKVTHSAAEATVKEAKLLPTYLPSVVSLKDGQYDPDPVKEWKLARDEEALPEQVAERNINEEDQENRVASVREGDYGYLFAHLLVDERKGGGAEKGARRKSDRVSHFARQIGLGPLARRFKCLDGDSEGD